jgi:exonuclease VII small subunit
MTKTTEAIQHITAGELADDSDKAIKEFDMAAALMDELSSSLAQQQKEAEVVDAGEDEPEEEPEEGDGGGEPEDDEPEGEPAEGGVRGSVTDKAGMVGEKVGAVKESVPTPPRPLALAGLGVVAGLAAFGALKALSGRGGGAEGE